MVKEDEIPANNVGSGNVEGTGVGKNGEPGVNKKKKLRTIISPKPLRRIAS